MRFAHIISIFACLFFILASNGRADDIIIAADRWCPINCDPADSEPGVMVEIARRIFSGAGHTVEYRILPWARAVKTCRNGLITGVIGAFVGDAPDFIFPENELLMISGNALFVAKDSKWIYTDIPSLSDVNLGAILNYDYGEKANNYIREGKKVQLISSENPLDQNILKLLIGRIDVIIEAEPVFWYVAGKKGVHDKFKKAGQISDAKKCYIAFSPAIPKSGEYARILSDGIDTLRQSGELGEILHRYGLSDWKDEKQ